MVSTGDGRTVGPEASPIPPVPPARLEAERHRLRVKLAAFEGPLDLLLHLVRINEVDIYDIPVIEIARQYDEYLEMMKCLDLDIAGEFLVMAATLAYIKSRMLLPAPPGGEGDEEDDPRQELTQRLLEHERLLLAAEDLAVRSDLHDALWGRPPGQRKDLEGEVLLEASLLDLVRAFQELREAMGGEASLDLRHEGVSVPHRMAQILELLDGAELVDFRALFPASGSKLDHIVTFLALLELLRLQMVGAWQTRPFGEIRLARRVQPTGPVDAEAGRGETP